MTDEILFGKTPDGSEVHLFTISNKNGLELTAINYGAIIQSLKVPDRNGELKNVVLSYNSLSEYLADSFFVGAVVGRYGNRIANGTFTLNGTSYKLPQNNNGNHLHGGQHGFSKRIWKAEVVAENSIRFTYLSADVEEGYPGNLNVSLTYTLTDENEVQIEYKARTDKPTVVNLVQHSYFNLTGDNSQSVLDHELTVFADSFLPINNTMIPTGEFRSVKDTPFDFRKVKRIESQLTKDEQLEIGNGFDHCWVINPSSDKLNRASILFDPKSGRRLEVFTTKPGIHIYTGNFLATPFKKRAGICLETEYFPDSPNQINFPSAVLNPGDEYHHNTTFKFSV